MKYIFYDTETTGLSAAFDQILQFAAIVTDEDFSILEEVNLRGRRRPFVLPSPGVLMITGISPDDFENAPLSHYELITKIRALIERYSPAIMIGFNSISFDEGMLRQAFYQTLHPTYLTQQNGNSRMDVMRLAHAVAEHQPEAITVSLNEKGRPSFKLGALTEANGIRLSNAHDALADTRATLELARLLRDKAPDVWGMLFHARTKQTVKQNLQNKLIIVASDQAFGTKSILATPFAENADNNNEIALFDLANDPAQFFGASEAEALKLLTQSPRVIRILKANQLPIVRAARREDFSSLPEDVAIDRAKKIQQHKRFSAAVSTAMANRYEARAPSPYVEERIFDGFATSSDQSLFDKFHQAPWEERFALVEKLEDDRYREIGTRLIFEERPELLPEREVMRLEKLIRQRFASFGKMPWTTRTAADQELNSLVPLSERQQELQNAIRVWLDNID